MVQLQHARTARTVSMGLGPLSAVHQARFYRYLHLRGLANTSQSRVWCFVGDGEMDESETLSAIAVAGRERLNNVIFVAVCVLDERGAVCVQILVGAGLAQSSDSVGAVAAGSGFRRPDTMCTQGGLAVGADAEWRELRTDRRSRVRLDRYTGRTDGRA